MILSTQYCNIRLITEEDASFIVSLRQKAETNGFVSKSDLSVAAQEAWIKKYKVREAQNGEFYFITEAEGEKYGVMRVYDIREDSFTSGSWIFKASSPNQISVTTNILIRKFGFEYLNKEINYYDVRKSNSKVIAYNNMFAPEFLREDELSNYYFCRKDLFQKKAKAFNRLCGVDFSLPVQTFIQN